MELIERSATFAGCSGGEGAGFGGMIEAWEDLKTSTSHQIGSTKNLIGSTSDLIGSTVKHTVHSSLKICLISQDSSGTLQTSAASRSRQEVGGQVTPGTETNK
jgi:hypothetical protein